MIAAIPGAVLIGLSLGLLGSGGSILTVPVLTLLVGMDEKVAIASSLAIVGLISLVGTIPYARSGRIDLRSAMLFGIPGMFGAWVGAFLGGVVSTTVQMLLFAAVMVTAALFMLRGRLDSPLGEERRTHRPVLKVALEGLAVGALTGLVGVGGGFLIVPALVFLGGLSMQRAIGTSLLIIALKSGVSFVKYLEVLAERNLAVDPKVILVFAAMGIVGSFIGAAMASRLPQLVLRRAFAVLCLVVAVPVVWTGLA